MIILAIDPGSANGGIAILEKNTAIKCFQMTKFKNEQKKMDAKKMVEFFAYYFEKDSSSIAYVESQSLRRLEDQKKMFGMQKLFNNYQTILNCLDIAGIKVEIVHPRTWQSQLRLVLPRGTKEDPDARKNRYKEAAQYYFPDIKATLWNADALLIAEYARRLLKFFPENWRKKTTLY